MELENYLDKKIRSVILKWKEKDIYAISFFLNMNGTSEYCGIHNFPEFSIGYNTEKDCNFAPELSEERWNFAYWSQNNVNIISTENTESANLLIDWYNKNGIQDIGFEDFDNSYNEDGVYIGRGPNGYYELLSLISNIAQTLQEEEFIKSKFGRIPIIVHDYEYPWYILEATQNANPNGEADIFLKAVDNDFCE